MLTGQELDMLLSIGKSIFFGVALVEAVTLQKLCLRNAMSLYALKEAFSMNVKYFIYFKSFKIKS